MLIRPEVQIKAQAELDQVVGPHRLPTLDDRHNLPYITAIVKETMRYVQMKPCSRTFHLFRSNRLCLYPRWQPPCPTALPHLASQEDDYKGYRIPAGSIVIGNVWYVLELHVPL